MAANRLPGSPAVGELLLLPSSSSLFSLQTPQDGAGWEGLVPLSRPRLVFCPEFFGSGGRCRAGTRGPVPALFAPVPRTRGPQNEPGRCRRDAGPGRAPHPPSCFVPRALTINNGRSQKRTPPSTCVVSISPYRRLYAPIYRRSAAAAGLPPAPEGPPAPPGLL